MFLNNMGGAMALGTPCVQNVSGVPTPSVNVVFTTTAIPTVYNIIYGGMPVINQISENMTSIGSIPSGGVVTAGICNDSQHISCSTIVNMGGLMMTRTTDVTGHNININSVGAYIVPAPPYKMLSLR